MTYSEIVLALPHTYAVQGLINVASGATNYLPTWFCPVPAGQRAFLIGVRGKVRAGSCTLDVVQGHPGSSPTSVAGMTSLSITTTPATTYLATAVEIFDGEEFGVVIDTITSTPDGLSLTFFLNYKLEPDFS